MTYLAIPPKGQYLPKPTEFIPLPRPRPEIPPSTESEMPLERPTEPAGALFSEPATPVAPDTQIDLYGLPRGLSEIKEFFMEKINYIYTQLNTGGSIDFVPQNNEDIMFFMVAVGFISLVVMGLVKLFKEL